MKNHDHCQRPLAHRDPDDQEVTGVKRGQPRLHPEPPEGDVQAPVAPTIPPNTETKRATFHLSEQEASTGGRGQRGRGQRSLRLRTSRVLVTGNRTATSPGPSECRRSPIDETAARRWGFSPGKLLRTPQFRLKHTHTHTAHTSSRQRVSTR